MNTFKSFGCYSAVLLLLAGCASSRKVTVAPAVPGTIPLEVFIVTDGLPFGEKGWRGTENDVVDFIQKLIGNEKMYALNADFGWSGQVTLVENPGITRPMTTSAFYNAIVLHHWTANHINIYFAGQVGVGVLSFNIDPEEAQSQPLPRSITVVNDGFDNGFSPQALLAGNALEHEITHFFARWLNRTFTIPGPVRTYNAQVLGMHTEHVPDLSINILDLFFPYPDLVVPGRSNQVGSERNDIWNRIDQNRVFVP